VPWHDFKLPLFSVLLLATPFLAQVPTAPSSVGDVARRIDSNTAQHQPCRAARRSTSSFLVAMASLLRVSSRRTFPGRNSNGLTQAIVFYPGAAARSECPHRHSPRTETQGSELFIVAAFAQRATACCARSFWAWPAPTATAPCSAWSSWLPIGTPCPQHGFQP
jgi:hypothetical protein